MIPVALWIACASLTLLWVAGLPRPRRKFAIQDLAQFVSGRSFNVALYEPLSSPTLDLDDTPRTKEDMRSIAGSNLVPRWPSRATCILHPIYPMQVRPMRSRQGERTP